MQAVSTASSKSEIITIQFTEHSFDADTLPALLLLTFAHQHAHNIIVNTVAITCLRHMWTYALLL